jgi:hypothetical protein
MGNAWERNDMNTNLKVTTGPFKAIFTKYLGPTDQRGARIKAYASDGKSVTIPFDHYGSCSHRLAVIALCEKLGWDGEWIGGGGLNGNVYVSIP